MRNGLPASRRSTVHRDHVARLVLDSAVDFAILSVDLDGRITSWNPGAEQLLGWTEDKILGQDACVIFTDEDRASGACERERAIAARDGRAEDDRWHQRKDGSRVNGGRIPGHDGGVKAGH